MVMVRLFIPGGVTQYKGVTHARVLITWITIISELFSNLIPISKNLRPSLKGFIEPHCITKKQ